MATAEVRTDSESSEDDADFARTNELPTGRVILAPAGFLAPAGAGPPVARRKSKKRSRKTGHYEACADCATSSGTPVSATRADVSPAVSVPTWAPAMREDLHPPVPPAGCLRVKRHPCECLSCGKRQIRQSPVSLYTYDKLVHVTSDGEDEIAVDLALGAEEC